MGKLGESIDKVMYTISHLPAEVLDNLKVFAEDNIFLEHKSEIMDILEKLREARIKYATELYYIFKDLLELVGYMVSEAESMGYLYIRDKGLETYKELEHAVNTLRSFAEVGIFAMEERREYYGKA